MPNPFYQSRDWRALRKACIDRDHGRCAVPGCPDPGRVADHIKTRPLVPHLTEFDVLSNLRTLCLGHDAQVKERRRGESFRKNGGKFRVIGCDVTGQPFDPARR